MVEKYIQPSDRCNGNIDCEDFSDEKDCNSKKTISILKFALDNLEVLTFRVHPRPANTNNCLVPTLVE